MANKACLVNDAIWRNGVGGLEPGYLWFISGATILEYWSRLVYQPSGDCVNSN